MMHLHTEHFLSARIRNRVFWQESSDFFPWLHKLLGHLIELERMGFLQLLTADMF